MEVKMEKIPVKIVQYTIDGQIRKNVMIDYFDSDEIEGDVEEKLDDFKKQYFELVKKAKKILPKKKRKTSDFWKLGKLLYDFNKSIEHEFEITNLGKAFARDFELPTSRYVEYILRFGEFFKKNDVSDGIGISHYVEIINKIHALKKLGILESEKKRLLQRAKDKTLPPHKEYREDLNKLTKT